MTKHGSMIALSCDIYVPNALICPIKLIKKKKNQILTVIILRSFKRPLNIKNANCCMTATFYFIFLIKSNHSSYLNARLN